MHLLTFDIEDWYLSYHSSQIPPHLWPDLESRTDRNTRTILNFLEQHQLKATFFFLGYEAKSNPALVRDIHRSGHEIGFHSVWHEPPYAQTAKAFESDLKEGIALLQDLVGDEIVLYRAPMFSLDDRTPWVPEILLQNGIRISSSIYGAKTWKGEKLPRQPFLWKTKIGNLLEFPLIATRWGGVPVHTNGGGYFRILPYPLLKLFLLAKDYNVFYFHPRDFDIQLPKSKYLPFYRNLMGRLGNRTTAHKIKRLTEKISFISIKQAAAQLDYATLRGIEA